jgi:hypothetical protein
VTTDSALREDLFVSACIPESPTSAADVEAIVGIARQIGLTWRYYEVLIVAEVNACDDDRLRECLARCPNLRVIKVRGSLRHYSRRVVAANEVIGDLIVFTSLAEAGALDLAELTKTAAEKNAITIFTIQRRSWSDPLLSVLGSASRLRISMNDMRTMAVPRTWLNRLLSHPEHHLALRFPPLGEGFPIHHLQVVAPKLRKSVDRGSPHRMRLLYDLAVGAAPLVLIGVAALSALVVVGAVLYMGYAVAVLFFVKNVQPGWFTTSLVLAGTAAYLAAAILGLSAGLQKLLQRLEPKVEDTIVEEMTNGDLFDGIRELNVATDVLPASPDR